MIKKTKTISTLKNRKKDIKENLTSLEVNYKDAEGKIELISIPIGFKVNFFLFLA